jgi:hypothetical protein
LPVDGVLKFVKYRTGTFVEIKGDQSQFKPKSPGTVFPFGWLKAVVGAGAGQISAGFKLLVSARSMAITGPAMTTIIRKAGFTTDWTRPTGKCSREV